MVMSSSQQLGRIPLASLPEGVGRRVVLADRQIAIFRLGATILAIDAACPHSGGPLEEGMVCGDVVVCPLHLRRVNLRTGEVEDWPEVVRTYDVIVEADEVVVSL